MAQAENISKLLQSCEDEKLHLSGAIQTYGALVAFDVCTGLISHASNNLFEFTETDPHSALGVPITDMSWIHPLVIREIPEEQGKLKGLTIALNSDQNRLCAQIVRSGSHAIIEIEHSLTLNMPLSLHEYQKILLHAPYTQSEFQKHNDVLLGAIKDIIGFDRVMIYKFQEDWSGQVIGEVAALEIGSYNGLRFPASDIPEIARNLYLINPLRLIPDSQAGNVPIISSAPDTINLTWTNLRSVSPVHLQYLENMGVRASLSIPIRVSNRLWGLVACHHLAPKLPSQEARAACVTLVNSYALALTSHLASRRLSALDSLERQIEGILEVLAETPDPLEGVEKASASLLEIMGADGIALAMENDVVTLGVVPNLDDMAVVDDWFLNKSQETTFLTGHLQDIFPDELSLLAQVSGMAAIKSRSVRSGWVRFYWFRSGETQTVAWAGNPRKPLGENAGAVTLSPRRSFERWIETKSGYSSPWSLEQKRVASIFRTALLRWI